MQLSSDDTVNLIYNKCCFIGEDDVTSFRGYSPKLYIEK